MLRGRLKTYKYVADQPRNFYFLCEQGLALRMPSYYDVLKITPQASDEEVKRAYRLQALKHHPDRNPANRTHAEQRFHLINEAYSALKTRESRIAYNRMIRETKQSAINDNNGQSLFARLWSNFIGSKV